MFSKSKGKQVEATETTPLNNANKNDATVISNELQKSGLINRVKNHLSITKSQEALFEAAQDQSQGHTNEMSPEMNENDAQGAIDPVRKALSATPENTDVLTGTSATIRGGIPIEFIATQTLVFLETGCAGGVRAGVSPIVDQEISTSSKPLPIKTKTFQHLFIMGTIPKADLFRRPGDQLPELKDLPEGAGFVPMPVHLSRILHGAEGKNPTYEILGINDTYLQFRACKAPTPKFETVVFSLDLSKQRDKDFLIEKQPQLLPWKNVSMDVAFWRNKLGSKWDEAKLGSFEESISGLYVAYMQSPKDSVPQPVEVLAINGHVLTGDIDMCYLALPSTIKLQSQTIPTPTKFTRIYETYHNDAEQRALIEAFQELYVIHQSNVQKRFLNNPYQVQPEELAYVTKFVQTAGNITPFELLNALLTNQNYRKQFPFFDDQIKHGAEQHNWFKPCPLDTISHVYIIRKPTFNGLETISEEAESVNKNFGHATVLTFNETEFADVLKKYIEAGMIVHINPLWPMKIFGALVELQLKSPLLRDHVSERTKASYFDYRRETKSFLAIMGETIVSTISMSSQIIGRRSSIDGYTEAHTAMLNTPADSPASYAALPKNKLRHSTGSMPRTKIFFQGIFTRSDSANKLKESDDLSQNILRKTN